jgi:type I restriction enzyme S subunit
MKRWPMKRLGELCELINGRAFKPHEWESVGLPIIRIQNLNDPTKPFNYTRQDLPDKFRVKRGDTLLSWSGTPGTSFGCFRWDGPEGWLNQHIFNVRLGEEILSPFFIHQVNSKLDELIGKAHGGVGLQHITKGALSSIKITIPTLGEQRRIMKLLDEADELRKLRAQADSRTAALIPALFHEMFGGSNSSPFSCRPLKDVSDEVYRYPTYFGIKYIQTGVPEIRGELINDDYSIEQSPQKLRYISQTTSSRFPRTQLRDGDLVMTVRGTIGKLGLVPKSLKGANITANLLRISPRRDLLASEFLVQFLVSGGGLSKLAAVSTSTTIQTIKAADLKQICIPLPPLTLQKKFANRVTEIRMLQAEQAASRERLDALFNSMLHRAFQGEL